VPLEGVNLPLHFLIRCRDPEGETFIDAFARGRFLTRTDCRDFLREAGLEDKAEFLAPATDREVLVRLTRCLVSSYQARGASAAVERFGRCLSILSG
jgi:regulator of sirC expression with transglutaminase-like and TPR domain